MGWVPSITSLKLEDKQNRREKIKAVNNFSGKIEDMTKEVSAILTERIDIRSQHQEPGAQVHADNLLGLLQE